jgi:rod shape-determining protein MreD
MKKKFIYCVITIVAILLQTSFLPVVFGRGSVPDAVLMLILALAVLDGFFATFSWAIFIGFLYDLASYSKIGMHVILFLMVVYFVSFFSRRFSFEIKATGIFLFGFFVLVAVILSQFLIGIQNSFGLDGVPFSLKSFWGPLSFILQLFYDGLLFMFWFYLLKKAKTFFALEV